jgi:hypothetical protein
LDSDATPRRRSYHVVPDPTSADNSTDYIHHSIIHIFSHSDSNHHSRILVYSTAYPDFCG